MTVASLSALGGSVPVVNPALEPAAIRNGDEKARQAYGTGLAFEQMLVDQLSQALAATASTDGSGAGAGGMLSGSDPANGTLGNLLPQALGQGVMSAGGLGIASQIAASVDPSLRGKL